MFVGSRLVLRSMVVVGLVMVGPAVLLAADPTSEQRELKQPNILFIFSDDHAAQAIGCYGSKINETPNIDTIAKTGMVFDNCFCTNSICGPSRAVILTGKHSHLNGFRHNGDRFDGTQLTFPKLLQKSGYQTAMFGKWHLKSNPTGFDEWEVLIGQGPYYNPRMIRNGKQVEHTGYTTDIITDITLDFLKEKRDSSKPFMVMYQHKAPHRNWQPGPNYLHKYDDVTIPEPPTLFDDYATRGRAAREQEMTVAEHLNEKDLKLVPPDNLTEEQLATWNAAYEPKNEEFRAQKLSGKELVRWKYQRYMKDYLRCIASMDDNIGRVLDYLDASGLAENTIVIYSSDQGFYLGEHGWFDKRFMYEESYRMPFIVRWPGKTEPGSRHKALVTNLDFAETFLDAAGVDIPREMQGESLVPLMSGKTPEGWRESLYYHYYEYPAVHMVHRHFGVRTDRYKLMNFYQIDEQELYDLETDPLELNNLYNDPDLEPVREKLTAELERLQKKYAVPSDDQ
ncbi:MAG: sulfatase [Planctomycetaceae bacterium]